MAQTVLGGKHEMSGEANQEALPGSVCFLSHWK